MVGARMGSRKSTRQERREQRYARWREYRHMFFLTDAANPDVKALLEKALRRSLVVSLVWLGASPWRLVAVNLSAASFWSRFSAAVP